MPRGKKVVEEVAGAAAVLDAPETEGTGEQSPEASVSVKKLVRFWSPENERLIIGADPVVQFIDHTVVIDPDKSPRTYKALKGSNAFKSSFFIVEDRAGDDDYKIDFGRRLRALVGDDRADQVKRERGFISILSMFSPDELMRYGISKSMPDIEKAIYVAVNNKYVEGYV